MKRRQRLDRFMPTCRHCFGVYPRNQFIHGIGPRAQVCVRCGVEKGLVEPEEVPSLYDKSTTNARFSAISRRWAPVMWLTILWFVWIIELSSVSPWNWFTLALLIASTVGLPLYMLFFSGKHVADMARLTPEYERPKGH